MKVGVGERIFENEGKWSFSVFDLDGKLEMEIEVLGYGAYRFEIL